MKTGWVRLLLLARKCNQSVIWALDLTHHDTVAVDLEAKERRINLPPFLPFLLVAASLDTSAGVLGLSGSFRLWRNHLFGALQHVNEGCFWDIAARGRWPESHLLLVLRSRGIWRISSRFSPSFWVQIFLFSNCRTKIIILHQKSVTMVQLIRMYLQRIQKQMNSFLWWMEQKQALILPPETIALKSSQPRLLKGSQAP